LQAAHGEPAPPEAEPPVGGEATVITEPVEAGGTDEAAIDLISLCAKRRGSR